MHIMMKINLLAFLIHTSWNLKASWM